MEHYQEDDLTRIRELLRHTGEFIAYFEFVEAKMMEWREEIEQQAEQVLHMTQSLQNELTSMQSLISQSGVSHFKISAEKALAQGETHLHSLERTCNQFTQIFQQQQEKIKSLTENCIDRIEKHTSQATQTLTLQLAKYDVQHFYRIANESCDHVDRVANDAINKSNKMLNMFQFKVGLFAMLITVLTAFVIVIYLNDEMPWEMHHQAMSERQAGKVLLQAWPKLSQKEKAKILNEDVLKQG
ncbi:hypothetical protein OQJ02_14810 [Legionella sp. PATHC032]|uniref:hypothetical protein n=1 Tax=Legionella sp. PATHC032 TaxID=2992039 RepID=UPI001B25AE2F|nr:hypothetical protein [Legionella sp. PATHC032]MCW8422897.1 hypothetical protein [Legionella sp. PATHC032]HAZ7572792.1 hypothetical protein [Legionella pneumophila]HBA1636056.1 hypothetical protein [Legionella pneumophila]